VRVSTLTLSSPRQRRRLLWATGIVAAIVAVVVAIDLLPTHSAAIEQQEPTVAAAPTTQQPVQATGEPRTVKPPRKELNALLDAFVPAVIAGKNLAKGWELVTPDARGSRRDWMRGDTQFQRFDARIEQYHGWTVNYSYPGDVGFDLFVAPRDPKNISMAFRGEAKKVGGKWRVAVFYPQATFQPAGKRAAVFADTDLQPQGTSAAAASGRLSAAWLLLPGAVIVVAIVGALGFALVVGVRRRARVKAIERDLAQLP
jgi:hypothetical protein